MTKHYKAL